MALSGEEIQAIADDVATWRLQDNFGISIYAFNVYYVLTTLGEEVSVIYRQKWGCGKILFLVIRYGMCIYVALDLIANFRNYYYVSPEGCKALGIVSQGDPELAVLIRQFILTGSPAAAIGLAHVACDVALGLCLSALLGLHSILLAMITLVSAFPSSFNLVIMMIARIQYPLQPVPDDLDKELGYPCAYISTADLVKHTAMRLGRNERRYLYFSTTIVLLLVAVVTLAVRYRGRNHRLLQVLRRDGGIYYVVIAAIRLAHAIISTPRIIPVSKVDGNAGIMTLNAAGDVVVPILAQRLLLNMRKVDYQGTECVGSKLLFAPGPRDSVDEFDEKERDTFKMQSVSSGIRSEEEPSTAAETLDSRRADTVLGEQGL
ncbi:hypothetical protein NMY22_g2116 [Coprinellus aureogranulatus]|nr:hypothetical protein NMY22_g2116 [Coprinellus aureogranulatus]